MVDLALTDEQEQLVASFANLLAKGSSPEQVRAAEATNGFDAALWRTLRDTGAVVMAVPEQHGGWGASMVDLVLVAEQLGRAAAPAPVIEAQVAARLLGRARDDELVTLAVRPASAGVAALVPGGAVCDAVVLLDGDGDGDGTSLRLVPVDDTVRRPVANLADAPLADLDIGPDAGEIVATGDEAIERFEAALDEWLTLTAAAVVGSAAAALETACAYAAERRAFGSVIGSFQGIAHPLADAATNVDGARLLAQKAAWALDGGHRRRRELAAMAFAFASTAAEHATYVALHTHGGYGFMVEYDVQLHWRRARGWPRVWGDAGAAYRRAADARYGRGSGAR